jgi:hypothetical protein
MATTRAEAPRKSSRSRSLAASVTLPCELDSDEERVLTVACSCELCRGSLEPAFRRLQVALCERHLRLRRKCARERRTIRPQRSHRKAKQLSSGFELAKLRHRNATKRKGVRIIPQRNDLQRRKRIKSGKGYRGR